MELLSVSTFLSYSHERVYLAHQVREMLISGYRLVVRAILRMPMKMMIKKVTMYSNYFP